MKFVLFGASGYLGRALTRHLATAGHSVVLVSRSDRSAKPDSSVVSDIWDGKSLGSWADHLEGADAIVNMAGRTVNCRYNEKNKAEIYASRLDSTRVIGEAVAACIDPPRAWLNSSTATIYRDSRDRPMDEESGETGKGFSVDVAQKWEQTFFAAPTPKTRRVALRSSMVMGPGEGGPFEAYDGLVKKGLGGPMAGGGMMVSWIHLDDFCRAVEWLAANSLEGVVNVCSPNPVSNKEFMRAIVEARGARIAIPTAKWMIELGAMAMGTESELPLKSRWVVPKRLLEAGFEFQHPVWGDAVTAILATSELTRTLSRT